MGGRRESKKAFSQLQPGFSIRFTSWVTTTGIHNRYLKGITMRMLKIAQVLEPDRAGMREARRHWDLRDTSCALRSADPRDTFS